MIHQFIFAAPKPGLSAEAFQSYWVNFHAVDYAAKIPQIRKYLVATRIHISDSTEVPFFEGVAEIWLENEREQISSLQTPEFLQGARLDEPRWAAFWLTFVHDADPVTIIERKDNESDYTKLYVFLKRKTGCDLRDFKEQLKERHAELVVNLPGLQQYLLGFARDALYGFGEPRFDAIEVYSFLNLDELNHAFNNKMNEIRENWATTIDERYLFTMVGVENWIIREWRLPTAM